MLWPHCTPGKDPIPIVQETGWAPEPVWTGGKSRPYRDPIPDRPARSQSLYLLSYPAHGYRKVHIPNSRGRLQRYVFVDLFLVLYADHNAAQHPQTTVMLVKTYTQYAQNHLGFSISSDRISD